ncbi:AAA-domain-containing protein [Athelia psychrophila]|uniref:AAA-domain-containing protein n=1 Tax=Athelia psychrophila TaxID=1759441 RepID=A0A166RYW7_9AGAM|nr:AAA-domain-containing protein [Fibularhizoctonia sp. CBS 109695]
MVSGQHPNGGSLTRSLVGVVSSAVEELKALGHWPLAHAHLSNTAKLLLLGPAIETCRRVFLWVMDRFRLKYCISARFMQGDPAFDWLNLFMASERVCRSGYFTVSAKSSSRKWGVNESNTAASAIASANADYVPVYDTPQLFRWNKYWVEILITLATRMYTLNMSALTELVEEARIRYLEVSKSYVTVFSTDAGSYGHVWSNVKQKPRRPLDTVILEDGMAESIVKDAMEFLQMEDYYVEAGIPHRRGYLLHGPPGVGKTSTIYAMAGELGLEIYSLSLASSHIDDSFLQRAMASIPKRSIVLIEDIDCAFRPRDEHASASGFPGFPPMMTPSSGVTLSGLLNMLDGVGSEEGKLFFATTNHIDRLDPALLRPGRIDRKIQYKLSTQRQAAALFQRFFPASRFASLPPGPSALTLGQLGEQFAAGVPDHTFSTAQLQGYLLTCKMQPLHAAQGIGAWVEEELEAMREERERKDSGAGAEGILL